jgi:hypothetical protein
MQQETGEKNTVGTKKCEEAVSFGYLPYFKVLLYVM